MSREGRFFDYDSDYDYDNDSDSDSDKGEMDLMARAVYNTGKGKSR